MRNGYEYRTIFAVQETGLIKPLNSTKRAQRKLDTDGFRERKTDISYCV